MLGRVCPGSTRRQQRAFSIEDTDAVKASLADYACPDCGAQRYHLVFRVNALNHRATLAIVCDTCRVRQSLLEDDHGHAPAFQHDGTIDGVEACPD